MNKYIGKYRIMCEKDANTGKPINNGENTYIKCRKGAEIYRYNDRVLVLYVPSRTRANNYQKSLLDTCFEYEYGDYEARIYFYEEYLDKVAEICKPIVKGNNIKPKNKRSYKNSNSDNINTY